MDNLIILEDAWWAGYKAHRDGRGFGMVHSEAWRAGWEYRAIEEAARLDRLEQSKVGAFR